ncbi:DegT/DnrJ/EryC1/StrS family aminotransferase [Streptomyces sp. NPDC050610]|uniref:DegT/DnrJ/EryC1/StrS family aminotransferase n=1 Tax=Streptomyces sp. NPDC050610 TaxID=3157097 RepID=UPI0034467DEF
MTTPDTAAGGRVPFNDLGRTALADTLRAAVDEVVAAGDFIHGHAVDVFERRFAARNGAAHCVGTSSGTSALQCALEAVGCGPGDEVVTVSATFVATAAAIAHTGAAPVFTDIDPVTRTARPDQVRAAVTPRTRAIVPVHLYGHPADPRELAAIAAEHGIPVVADASHAHGASWEGRPAAAYADVSCFSFYPSKNLGAFGDAGALVTDDPDTARRARALRDHGRQDGEVVAVGHNWRMDTLQAAVLDAKLPHLDEWTAARRRAADRYRRLLEGTGLGLPAVSPEAGHAYHLYVVRHPQRAAIQSELTRAGIDARVHYPRPVHELRPFRAFRTAAEGLPETEALSRQCLSLPLFPGITDEEVDTVAHAVRAALRTVGEPAGPADPASDGPADGTAPDHHRPTETARN